MSRRYWSKATLNRPILPARSSPARYLAGLTLGILGTLYYAGHTGYADSMPSDPGSQSSDFPILWNGHLYKDSASHGNTAPEQWNTPSYDSYRDKIRQNSETARILANSGVPRIDSLGLPNYTPRQDACGISAVQLDTGPIWTIIGLLNGYNGWENIHHITPRLFRAVVDKLVQLVSRRAPLSTEHAEIGMNPPPDPQASSELSYSDAMDRKIKEAFLGLDNAIVHRDVNRVLSSPSKAKAMDTLSVALSGTSVLLSFYDLDTRLLKVALAGDSRAILGRRSGRKSGDQRVSSSYYEVHVLTADQISEPRSQLAVDVRSGPNESSLTRAFGLAAYKWSRKIQEKVHREYFGDPSTPNINTRSPLTAEPEIATIEVKPGDFLIMGSAGVWNSLTNEEAVGLVGLWLDRGMYQAAEQQSRPAAASPTHPPTQIILPSDLPVDLGAKDETVMYRRWGTEKQFVCTDINAAGHLARNVLGGANEDLTSALLSVEPPRCRKIRDEISTVVIFFDG